MTAGAILHVAVGVIRNNKNQVLLSRRAGNVDHPDLWEFPGGKLEHGETVTAGLKRELNEELGLKLESASPLIKIHHDYDAYSVLLDVWSIDSWTSDCLQSNAENGQEGQKIEWVDIATLDDYTFPAANKPIIKAVQLPEFYLICPQPENNIREYIDTFKTCISAGVSLVQLRFGEESEFNRYRALISELLEYCRENDSRLLLNSTPEYALAMCADGAHLNSSRLMQLNERPFDNKFLLSASCHDAKELEHASRLQLDFAVLSPVKRTTSHPEAQPLGWNKFGDFVESPSVPVYALGGMQAEDLKKSIKCGGQGIAVLGGIWKSDNVINALNDYLSFKRSGY